MCINSATNIRQIEKDFLKTSLPQQMNFYISDLPDCQQMKTDFVFSPHQNDFYQIFLYYRGSGIHQIDLDKLTYRPQTLVAAARGQVQVLENAPQTGAYILSFSEQFLYRYEEDMQWLHQLNLFNVHQRKRAVYLSDLEFENMQQLVLQMKKEYNSKNDVVILRDLLRVFIQIAERAVSGTDERKSESGRDYNLYCHFRKILNENYKSCKTVKEYADKIYVTPKKLNHVTIRFGSKHAKKMIEDRLIMEIKRLLLYTSMNIKEIAAETGFKDMTNFVKFFKRNVQTTPAKYHQSVQNGTFVP